MTAEAASIRRRLLVLRHAKAASAPGLADLERPLADRGEGDATATGHWLRAAAVVPDLVICSPSRRTRQTWDAVQDALPTRPQVRYDDRVYRNTLDDLLDVVREVDDAVGSLLLVSHNPAAQDVTAALTAAGEVSAGFPTCTVADIELTGPWTAVSEGTGRLARFWSPPR